MSEFHVVGGGCGRSVGRLDPKAEPLLGFGNVEDEHAVDGRIGAERQEVQRIFRKQHRLPVHRIGPSLAIHECEQVAGEPCRVRSDVRHLKTDDDERLVGTRAELAADLVGPIDVRDDVPNTTPAGTELYDVGPTTYSAQVSYVHQSRNRQRDADLTLAS